MKKLLLTISTLLLAIFSFGQTTEWKIDHSHSNVTFEISHMVVSTVTGKFQDFEGKILADKADFTDANISFTIFVNSVNTNNEKRDEHLRNDDFFDIEKFPVITFIGKSLEKKNDKNYVVKGDFTMHGVTKAVELDVRFNGTIKDNRGNMRAGFKVKGEINRSDYGLTYNSVLEAGGFSIGNDVEFNVNLELIKQ